MSQFFEILIFSQDIWENVHYAQDKNLLSPKQNKLNLRHEFVDERQLKTIIMSK